MTKMEASDNYIYSRNYLKNICTISIIQPQEFYQALKKKTFLLIICEFHIMHPNSTHLPVFPYCPSALAPFPPRENKM